MATRCGSSSSSGSSADRRRTLAPLQIQTLKGILDQCTARQSIATTNTQSLRERAVEERLPKRRYAPSRKQKRGRNRRKVHPPPPPTTTRSLEHSPEQPQHHAFSYYNVARQRKRQRASLSDGASEAQPRTAHSFFTQSFYTPLAPED